MAYLAYLTVPIRDCPWHGSMLPLGIPIDDALNCPVERILLLYNTSVGVMGNMWWETRMQSSRLLRRDELYFVHHC